MGNVDKKVYVLERSVCGSLSGGLKCQTKGTVQKYECQLQCKCGIHVQGCHLICSWYLFIFSVVLSQFGDYGYHVSPLEGKSPCCRVSH